MSKYFYIIVFSVSYKERGREGEEGIMERESHRDINCFRRVGKFGVPKPVVGSHPAVADQRCSPHPMVEPEVTSWNEEASLP